MWLAAVVDYLALEMRQLPHLPDNAGKKMIKDRPVRVKMEKAVL